MARKDSVVTPLPATDPVINTRILVPERKAGDPSARPHVSRDPLYETDRYRLVTPITDEPGQFDAPAIRPGAP
ncbi:MAG: hypothetical protein L0323_12085 [Planctomycetes bacterium]|nr:hypothetical protein [Planctomycetota bacterium]